MATREVAGEGWRLRCVRHTVCMVLLMFLGHFAQGQGPGAADTSMEMTVVEESESGVVVGTLPIRGGYTYGLEDSSPLFELDNQGVVRTKVQIDRETLQSDSITLFVDGNHPTEAFHSIELTIRVLDINDNAPRFDQSVVSEAFQEDAHEGQQQLIITAVDPDKGLNGTVTEYQIVSGNEDGKFRLTPPSDETPFMFIVTQGDLDRETRDFYQLNISARDGGDSPLYGYLKLNIDITDINDNPPSFDPSDYVAKVNENAEVGTSVIRVEASDDDIGENAEIYYSVIDSSGQFRIEERTGVIRTLTSPLYCSRPSCGRQRTLGSIECDPNSCLLTVESRDGGRTPQSGRAYVSVTIIDENDHDPIITFQPTTPDPVTGIATIDENASGVRVASISVTDADRGVNGQTSVQIVSGNEADHFRLVSLTIQATTINYIQVKGQLDRETIPRYNLTVKAVDKGTPPRSSTAYLIITVNDANDHSPVFERSEYRTRMSELAMPGSFVTSVKAVDEDSGPNSHLKYTIVTGNDQGWFHVDVTTGLVTTRVALDHEVSPRVTLNISASDSTYSNFTRLLIHILDENDMAPRFRTAVSAVEVEENQAVSQFLVTLTADDFDSGINGSVSYEIHPDTELVYPDMFHVHSSSGRVTTLQSLDREEVTSCTLWIIAKDGGSPSLSSTATIHLTVKDANDNVPEFQPDLYYVNVFETDPAGVQVVQVQATDRDAGSFGRVTYSFTGSVFNSFTIDPDTGVITTTTVLRRNVGRSYRLSVVATDGGGRQSSGQATVNVVVANINDPAPQFSSQSVTFNITEDSGEEAGSVEGTVGQVQATGGGGTSITYSITKGDPRQVFSIDAAGVIRRNKVVDREQQDRYVLTIIATTGSRFGETTAVINVRDVNDNSPVFRVTRSEVTVPENWPAGNNIFMAAADDADTGSNAQLFYTLVSEDDPHGIFQISQDTGIISLQKPASQINASQVTLRVTVRDSGTPQRSNTLTIVGKIQDVNDHTPIFPHNVYSIAILESRPVNEIIIKFVATDMDEGRNGELVYSILRGNEEGRFGIFPDGTLFIAHSLDRESRDMYSLMIQVHDCGDVPRSSSANITIYILDSNDNVPVFSNSSYTFSVTENRPAGTFVGSVKASDSDVGQNAELLYSLIESNVNFTIDPISGALYTRRPFDREYVMDTSSVQFYTVDVFATDGGTPRLRGKTSVRVFITDVNDNAPVFARSLFSAAVSENGELGTKVIKMTATDADIGANGAVSYVITDGNIGGVFRIGETSGEVTVDGPLDRESRDHYLLTVLATDTGSGQQLSSSAQVSITIMDDNDQVPQFTSTVRQLSVQETTPIGDLLTVFTGQDLDLGNNAKMYFSIFSGNEDNVFKLDGYTGKLYLLRPLDYEAKHEYLLNISISDEGYRPSLSSYIFFKVKVMDANDNAPVFRDGFKSINVPEDAGNNAQIARLRAVDRDSGALGMVRFAIISQDPNEGLFRIHPENGDIFVDGRLDRETTDYYKLVITATDQAEPPSLRLTTQKSLNIIIQDVNDNAPVFKSPPAFVVPSGKQRGQVVAEVLADDADTGDNGRVAYSLLTQSALFSLHPSSGRLTLLADLPASPLTHTLRVQARDDGGSDPNGRQSTETTITLLVTSAQAGPSFVGDPYSGTLSEDDWAGTTVFTVSATASRPGASVDYYLTGVVSGGVQRGGVFRVGAASGVVSSTAKLDREVMGGLVRVEITAAEEGEGGGALHTTTTQATVTLTDVNDTPPRFSPSVYNVSFPESEVKDGSVLKVGWTDPDTKGRVQLQLQGPGSESFDVLGDGTILATSLPLDREAQDQFTLLLSATDGLHTASATVTITVSDHNDNSPVFSRSPYYFEVPENADIGATVARVLATDADLGENARVTYDVTSTWASDLFQLDSVLGTFTLIGSLDYELRQVYTLAVRARDGGSPPRWGETLVYMNVVDVNDNEPEFDPASYHQRLSEDAQVGTTVINVSATDVDSGPNGEVRYSLLGEGQGHFSVDPVSGTVRTSAPLDREHRTRYDVIVMATDQAPHPGDRRSTTTVVTVELSDVNDCYPQFTSPNVTSVKEETANGTIIFTLSATDLDAGVNSHVTFTLDPLPGDPSYPFVLDPETGQLKVNTDLRREVRADYRLTVRATDGGTPPLSTSQTLRVEVEDVNNHPPRFPHPEYRLTLAEDSQVGTSLLRLEAGDADEGLNGVVRYFIASGDDDSHDLSLDAASGVLRLQRQLDYERRRHYRVLVRAEDSGVESTLTATATLLLTVTDVNDFQPVFDHSPYTAFVQEEGAGGEVEVGRVKARDEDSPPNSRLAYQLREGGEDVEGVFAVEPLTGRVTALVPLDRERVGLYTLTVIATDSGIPRLTGTGTLTVHVKDVNDHAPQFTSSAPYVAHVIENGDSSQSVITVTATDQDEGVNAQIIYQLESSEGGRFTVLPGTGRILTTRSLDREQHAHHHLVVMATDQGIPPKSASCHVIVYVDDVNDNAPAFEQAAYSKTIGDPTTAGDFVVGVTALDRDTGANGKVVYSLLQADDRFHIHMHTGVVTAAQRLSGQDASFSFQVLASDLGQPPLNSTVWVTVSVERVNGTPPTFAPMPTGVRVQENSPPGTVLTTVSATTSRASTLTYHIVGGNVNSALAINQNNGTITVAGQIDYEVVTSMTVWIRAQDGHPQPLSTYRPLLVTVQDRNDNFPRFNATWYQTALLENAPLGSSVLQVQAEDADSGANRQVRYQLAGGNTNNTFTIQAATGLISTANPVVDREGVPLYHLVVEARDQGSPQLTSTCTVKVVILDANDNPPVFSGLFSVAVPEDLPLHSLVLTLTSTDRDTPVHAVATYALIAGPDSAPFAVDPVSGNLTNVGTLDAESKERYRPEVSVSDSSFATKTQVTIRLLDVNDNAPQFLTASYGFDVQEGREAGTLVGRLEARDEDISSPNNEFYFSLKRPSTLFELHAESGEIRTLQRLEFQRTVDGPSAMNVHTLEVLVTDLGMPSLSSQAAVTITVTDANNHAPVFQHSEYTSAVPQNAGRGSSILRVEANDYLDFGLNADVTYSVSGGNGSSFFEVNPYSGVVSVRRGLTGQQGADLVVVVTATDRGDPPLSSSATLVLTVTDVNSYAPQFRNAVFTKSLHEDVHLGYTVDTLRASDRDTGLNGQVRFSISHGNEEGVFAMHPVSGSLTVAGALDYERKQTHFLTVVARDLALFSREASQVYTVRVVDVNDNSPRFNRSVFSSFVPENSPSGTPVLTLHAEDADTGNNAVVRYAFTGPSLLQRRFSIDGDSGSVRVEGELDYESRDVYSLTVMAFNPTSSGGGQALRKSVAEVRVYVTGVNEFVPRFLHREYRRSISESAAMNSTLLTLQASDADRGVDGVVYFYLLGPSNLRGFRLHPLTGDLVVVERPDYESSPFIVLTALAKNWGSVQGQRHGHVYHQHHSAGRQRPAGLHRAALHRQPAGGGPRRHPRRHRHGQGPRPAAREPAVPVRGGGGERGWVVQRGPPVREDRHHGQRGAGQGDLCRTTR
ncbi:cadherin-related tumor suppressor-like [Babylonia areolata]|uniref:cadherin-related tumor suppressor-like n=1 Tax=Babylonia areolata TaxID=304850 RepID=UPI003FD10083